MTTLEASTDAAAILAALESDGYAIVERFLEPAQTTALHQELDDLLSKAPSGRNDFEGFQTQRLYALFAKTRAFDMLAVHPTVLTVLDEVLGSYQLSAPQAIRIGPGERAQKLHRDDGIYPIARPHRELVLNTMWALDDFTAENGATHVVRGRQRWTDQEPNDSTKTVQAPMPAGAVMFFLGGVFHGGGANHSDQPRLGVIIEYCAAWLRQQENQYLAVPKDVARSLEPKMQELLGYNIHNNLIGNVDARHPRRWLEQ